MQSPGSPQTCAQIVNERRQRVFRIAISGMTRLACTIVVSAIRGDTDEMMMRDMHDSMPLHYLYDVGPLSEGDDDGHPTKMYRLRRFSWQTIITEGDECS